MLVDGITLTEETNIRQVKNVDLRIDGQLVNNINSLSWDCAENIALEKVYVSLGTAAVGTTTILLKKNGVTITESPIELLTGETFKEIPVWELMDYTAVENDVFQIELIGVGQTPGYDIAVQLEYVPPIGLPDSPFVYSFFNAISITKELHDHHNGSSNIELCGFVQNRFDYTTVDTVLPATPSSFGTIGPDLVEGLRISTFLAQHDKTLNIYRLILGIKGGYLPQTFLSKIYVDSLGQFETNIPLFGSVNNNSVTQWAWTISKNQYLKFKQSVTDSLRIYRESVVASAIDDGTTYLIPYTENVLATVTRVGYRDFSITSMGTSAFQELNRIQGLLLGPNTIAGSKIIFFQINRANTPVDGPMSGATSWNVQFGLEGPNLPQTKFGTITVAGLGYFSATSADAKGNTSDNLCTFWQWSLAKEQLWDTAKTASDLVPTTITFDDVPAGHDRSMVTEQYTDGASNVWKTFQQSKPYQNARGSISNRMYGSLELVCLGVIFQPAQNNRRYVLLRFHGIHTRTAFNWVDVNGLGRFYASQSQLWQNTEYGFTQYAWTIHQTKYDAFPATGSKAFKLQLV